MNKCEENYIEHEVRIRMNERIIDEIRSEFKDIKNDMKNQFLWTLGIIFGLFGIIYPLFGGIILHMAKLI